MAINPANIDRQTGVSYKRPTRTQAAPSSTPANIDRTTGVRYDEGGANIDFSGQNRQPNAGATGAALLGPAGGGGGGGGRGGYGGGGGGAAQQTANWNAYMQKVLQALGGLQAPTDTLTPRVNTAVDADLAAARGAYGNVGDRTSNAYEGLQFFAQQFDPQTAALLQSQGMGGDAALAQAQAGQQGMDGNRNAFEDFARAMQAVQSSSNDAWNADKGRDLAATESYLGAQRSALLTAAQMRQQQQEEEYKMKRLEAMLSLLSQGWGANQDVSGINFSGLL